MVATNLAKGPSRGGVSAVHDRIVEQARGASFPEGVTEAFKQSVQHARAAFVVNGNDLEDGRYGIQGRGNAFDRTIYLSYVDRKADGAAYVCTDSWMGRFRGLERELGNMEREYAKAGYKVTIDRNSLWAKMIR